MCRHRSFPFILFFGLFSLYIIHKSCQVFQNQRINMKNRILRPIVGPGWQNWFVPVVSVLKGH
jgi:hypothetical protein